MDPHSKVHPSHNVSSGSFLAWPQKINLEVNHRFNYQRRCHLVFDVLANHIIRLVTIYRKVFGWPPFPTITHVDVVVGSVWFSQTDWSYIPFLFRTQGTETLIGMNLPHQTTAYLPHSNLAMEHTCFISENHTWTYIKIRYMELRVWILHCQITVPKGSHQVAIRYRRPGPFLPCQLHEEAAHRAVASAASHLVNGCKWAI